VILVIEWCHCYNVSLGDKGDTGERGDTGDRGPRGLVGLFIVFLLVVYVARYIQSTMQLWLHA